MGPPSSMNFGKISFWFHIWGFYVVTVVQKKIRTITGGPWWTKIKVILIQKGLLDNQNPDFCMGWPGWYLLLDKSRASNIAFLLDIAQMSDSDFGLIQQNISIKKASFQYQGRPLSFKSCKLWLNSYIFRIRITSN